MDTACESRYYIKIALPTFVGMTMAVIIFHAILQDMMVQRTVTAMTRHEAYEYWLMRYNKAKDYDDPHWEAEERAAHHRWLEAMEQTMEALKDTSVSVDSDTVKLRKGVKKFRAENYVIYDIDFLLNNLAREIFLLYQTGKDFSKPAFSIDNIRRYLEW